MDQNFAMKRLRILIIENSIAITGSFNSILWNCIYLKDHIEFCFVLPKKSACVKIARQNGFLTEELSMRELSRRPLSWSLYFPMLLLNTYTLFRILSKLKINLIHVNDFYNLLPVTYKLLGGRVPYVCHVRFMPSRFPPLLLKILFFLHEKCAGKIITVSRAVSTELPASCKIKQLADGLPLPEENDNNFLYNLNSRIILYLSNYIKGKGQNYAIQAFSKIHHNFPEWKLRFVGGDMGTRKNKEFKRSLESMARVMGIGDKIEWSGFADDVGKEYKASAFLLNFSDSESFSMTCLEAMYYGIPVISTDSGGPSEIIDHMINGLLVPVKDIEGMSRAIELLMTKPALRKEMGSQAYTGARMKFNRAKLSEELSGVYLSLVHEDKGALEVS